MASSPLQQENMELFVLSLKTVKLYDNRGELNNKVTHSKNTFSRKIQYANTSSGEKKVVGCIKYTKRHKRRV